jgi:CBS domain-containing protein
MRLKDIMTIGIVTIDLREPATAARADMRRHRIRHLVVVEGGRVAGIISERDLGGVNGVEARHDRPVQELMTVDVVSATPSTTVRQAANLMRGHTIGCLLIVQDEELIGLVTTTDLLDQLGRGAARPTVRTGIAALEATARKRASARQKGRPPSDGAETRPPPIEAGGRSVCASGIFASTGEARAQSNP